MKLKEIKNEVTKEVTNGEYKDFEVMLTYVGMLVGVHVVIEIMEQVALKLAEEAHGRGYWLGEHNLEGIEGWEDFEHFKQEIL